MKRTIIVIAMILFAGAAITSCTAQKGGCKGTAGYVGYGSR
jgi:predicted small secreted protein